MEMDENGIVQYSNNPVIVKGQKLLSELPEKEGYAAINQEGYKIMAYRSSIGYVNAIALPENTYQKEMNMWRLKLLVIILVSWYFFQFSFLPLPVGMQTPQSISKTDDSGGKWIFTRGGTGV